MATLRIVWFQPSIPVDLLPGENDPSNYMLPQQPLHKCMFPLARKHRAGNLNLVTNPYRAELDGRLIVGTSGQNLDDIYRFSLEAQPLNLLEMLLEWQHLAPTAPDTLGSWLGTFLNLQPHVVGLLGKSS